MSWVDVPLSSASKRVPGLLIYQNRGRYVCHINPELAKRFPNRAQGVRVQFDLDAKLLGIIWDPNGMPTKTNHNGFICVRGLAEAMKSIGCKLEFYRRELDVLDTPNKTGEPHMVFDIKVLLK